MDAAAGRRLGVLRKEDVLADAHAVRHSLAGAKGVSHRGKTEDRLVKDLVTNIKREYEEGAADRGRTSRLPQTG